MTFAFDFTVTMGVIVTLAIAIVGWVRSSRKQTDDRIEAMGGRRLAPGEAVAALSEAIDVIRALWDTTGTGVLRVDGEHHSLHGAKRGPAPAHPVDIMSTPRRELTL